MMQLVQTQTTASSVRPSRLSLTAHRVVALTLCDYMLLQAAEYGLTSGLMKKNSGFVRLNCDNNIFSSCTSISSGFWRLECTERTQASRYGMTFKLFERRGSTDFCIMALTSPGLSEVGANVPRWVISRSKKGYFDSKFMKAVCDEIGCTWLLNAMIQPSSRIYGEDLTSLQSDFVYMLLSAILENMARALN
jgi:hypothetical protein